MTPLLGSAAAGFFLATLIASGISSSVVGTMAGQMIMQGFVGFHIPVWIRRLVTMAPAFAVVAIGVDATRALVLRQVALSVALPVPMIALVWFTSRAALMGRYRNSRITNVAALVCTAIVLCLNFVLVAQVVRTR
nr:Nramp family divalent metal transporter [Paraburkholderia hospita]